MWSGRGFGTFGVCCPFPFPLPSQSESWSCRVPFRLTVTLESAPAYPEDCQEYAQDRRGLDRTEVYQIREYVPGDSLSQIHWKLTSKRETLLVREPACPVEQSLLFLVDRTWGTLEPSQADTLMEAAASISQALCDQAFPSACAGIMGRPLSALT